MPKSAIPAKGCLVLLASPNEEDHWALIHILRPAGWAVDSAHTVAEAARSLEVERPQVVVTEEHLPDGTWRTLLNRLRRMDSPPKLIVTSRLADERLWSEVLNLGGFDVLAQPFNPREALRCIGEACHHWQEEYSKDQLEEAAGHMTA